MRYDSGTVVVTVPEGVTPTTVTFVSELFERQGESLVFVQSTNALSAYLSYPGSDTIEVAPTVHETTMQVGSGVKYFAERVTASYGSLTNSKWRHFKVDGATIYNWSVATWDAHHNPVDVWVDPDGYQFEADDGTEIEDTDTDTGVGYDEYELGATPTYVEQTAPGDADESGEG